MAKGKQPGTRGKWARGKRKIARDRLLTVCSLSPLAPTLSSGFPPNLTGLKNPGNGGSARCPIDQNHRPVTMTPLARGSHKPQTGRPTRDDSMLRGYPAVAGLSCIRVLNWLCRLPAVDSPIRYGISCATHGSVFRGVRQTVPPFPLRHSKHQVGGMALWDWLFRWIGWSNPSAAGSSFQAAAKRRTRPPRRKPVLTPTRRTAAERRARRVPITEVGGEPPYRLARFGSRSGQYLCLTSDHDEAALAERGMPMMQTPDDIADWLGMKLARLAWLVHHFSAGRAETPQKSHYSYHWAAKSKGGWRLIESPKKQLKQAQYRILNEILNQIPLHGAAHGFCCGRSIVTNAEPHAGRFVVMKWDLENFYPTVGFSRVVAIFRSVGYCREAAIWLARLTTTALPSNASFPPGEPSAMHPYLRRHLPQGAPTSPALANLSAYRLDVRLSGLARSFGATYTRYADDLTFSGNERFANSLRTFIPLVKQICRLERFRLHPNKRKVLRRHQRQLIAGVVVNAKPNIARDNFDRLKAILTNCVRLGPSTQNHEQRDNFSAHLQGCIAHVLQLNRRRGEKLLALYQRIDWNK